MPPRAKYVPGNPKVSWSPKARYRVWYCEQFPLARLRYRDLFEKDPGGRTWRQSLLEDIEKRGMKCPFMVYNHHMDRDRYPDLNMILGNKPYHLRVGRNRMWCVKQLGWEFVPVLGTGNCEYEHTLLTQPEHVKEIWPDGHVMIDPEGIHILDKVDPTNYEYPI